MSDQHKFWVFLAGCGAAIALTVLGLEWFYAGFFFGVVIGGYVFQPVLGKGRRA